MLQGMTKRLTVTLPDLLEARVRAAAGDNISAWAARAMLRQLMDDELKALAAAGALEPAEDLLADTEADLDAELTRRRGEAAA